MFKMYQFVNKETSGEYVVFVLMNDRAPVEDYAREGFEHAATAEDLDLVDALPSEGDCYMLDR